MVLVKHYFLYATISNDAHHKACASLATPCAFYYPLSYCFFWICLLLLGLQLFSAKRPQNAVFSLIVAKHSRGSEFPWRGNSSFATLQRIFFMGLSLFSHVITCLNASYRRLTGSDKALRVSMRFGALYGLPNVHWKFLPPFAKTGAILRIVVSLFPFLFNNNKFLFLYALTTTFYDFTNKKHSRKYSKLSKLVGMFFYLHVNN